MEEMMRSKSEGDDIMYIDEANGDISQPLTIKPMGVSFRARSGPMLETDNTYNPPPTSGPEIDDLDLDEKPTILYGGHGIDDGLLPDGRSTPVIPEYPSSVNPFLPAVPAQPTPDVNVYQQKKTLAQGMMDLALLSANANQLRYVLQIDGGHPYFYISLAMIGMSLFLQITIGIGLIWNSRYNVKDDIQMCMANKANNWTVVGIFLVTILNVFISSFGVIDPSVPIAE